MDFFKTGFGIFGVIFILLFILVFATFIVVFSRISRQKRKDDRSPRLTVAVTVVSRRADVRVHHNTIPICTTPPPPPITPPSRWKAVTAWSCMYPPRNTAC